MRSRRASAAYRIAFVNLGAFLLGLAVLGVVVFFAMHIAFTRQLDATITDEARTLVDEYHGGGGRELGEAIAERERDLAAHEAVLEERARIARELHDVIAHTVTVMVVQAQAGPDLFGDEARVRGAFGAIESSGREALTELRRLLGVLRTDDQQLAVGPQPGLASLQSLIQELREAGRRVTLRVEGTPVEVTPGVDLSAYRIVQEALTNTLKHAGEAETEVTVRYGDTRLELEIVDNGAGGSAPAGGPGHGLIGMRERVALYGGVLEAGARNGHGYAVRVRLPIDREATR
jgi:signal transduction histidine kinase